jgi:PhnB protein
MADNPIPEGYHAVTPFVISPDTDRFLQFMKDAFGAEETGRVVGDDGRIGHAEARIGDSVVMAFDAKPGWPDTPAFLRIYVENGDDTLRKALAAGGSTVTEMTNMPWGDRIGRVRDPVGNLWWIMTHLEDVSEEEMLRRYGLPEYAEGIKYVESSEFFPSNDRD